MDKIKLCLNNNKKYVIACSFGPDSMALLDAAIKENLNIVVAHVNYRKREASQFEQDSLQAFCDKRNIKLYVLDLIGEKHEGNFQEWAREKRYQFFKEVTEKEGATAVLVAHQQDDVIETYLMQKKRGNLVKNYGISRENELFGVKIIRPLLGFSKRELEQYDKENGVPFSIDESNLTDHYTRNQIRHSVVEKLSFEERNTIINEIESLQVGVPNFRTKFTKIKFLSMNYEQTVLLLDHFMHLTGKHRDISESYFKEIRKAFKSKTNHREIVTDKLWLELDYETVYLVNAEKVKPYEFLIDKAGSNEFIEVDFSNGAEDRGLDSNIQKFIIKNCCKNDTLIIKDYKSEIRRLFIDWKMPLFLREVWPGIYDGKGKLIYVPRYRENFKDEHKSKFKINTKFFLEF